MLPTLYHLPHSPWSLKARAAIRHHALPVEAVEYRPFLDEPALRWRLARAGGRFLGRVSVPVLFSDEGVAQSSWEVARYADRHGSGASLFPEAHLSDIARWDSCSETLLEAGRARFMTRVLANEPALRELVPPPLQQLPGFVVRSSIRMFNAKYGIDARRDAQYQQQMTEALDGVRAALSGGQDYLCGDFTYADIAIAVALQVVEPLPGSGFGPHSEPLASEPELATRYADLLTYRNRIQAKQPLFD